MISTPTIREICLSHANHCGFPALPLPHRPAERVMAGADGWMRFTANAELIDVAEVGLSLDDVADGRGGG